MCLQRDCWMQICRVSIFASRRKLWGNNDTGLWDNASGQNMLASRAETPCKFIKWSGPSSWCPLALGYSVFWENQHTCSSSWHSLFPVRQVFLSHTHLWSGSRLQFSCEGHLSSLQLILIGLIFSHIWLQLFVEFNLCVCFRYMYPSQKQRSSGVPLHSQPYSLETGSLYYLWS